MIDGGLIPMAVAAAVLVAAAVALVCWYVAARLGQAWAIGLPLIALAGFLVTIWERLDATPDEGLWFLAISGLVALPVLVGAAVGVGLYRWRRKVAAR